jgi:hypothetical protein
MNRKNLTAAVLAGLAGAAGIAGTAQAVNLNPDGLGQVLIYPYYTVNGGNATLLSVVNTTDEAKAVKVRFLEGQNSLEVLDFNLYLSAYDVWSAAVVNDNGTPTLLIADESCTVPDLLRDFGGSQAFLTFGLDDGGPNDISRTTEGHFEMIEMGVLDNYSFDSADAATHVAGVPPASKYLEPTSERPCGQLVDAWSVGDDNVVPSDDDGYWILDPLYDIENPTGGLFGGASIVNVEGASMFSYDARALNGFAYSRAPFGVPLHSEPGDENPNLTSGDIATGFVFTDDGAIGWADYGDDYTIDAVSYVFMHDAVMNEYVTGGETTANSEWVITFPTKFWYVNDELPIAPFVNIWKDNPVTGNWDACEPVLLDTVWNQEEQITNLPGDDPEVCPPVVSPAPPRDDCGEPDVPFALCYETNVIRFGGLTAVGTDGPVIPPTTELFGSSNYTNIDITALGFEAGWARVDLFEYAGTNDGGVLDGSRDQRLELGYESGYDGFTQWGLPVTGFWAFEAHTGYLEGPDGSNALGNYGGLFNHKATRCFYGSECRDSSDD